MISNRHDGDHQLTVYCRINLQVVNFALLDPIANIVTDLGADQ